MTYEQQNLAWQCLPSDAKKEVKQAFSMPTTNEYEQGYDNALVSLFGYHNLTSDAEGEEMLTVPRKKVLYMYDFNEDILICDPTHNGAKLLKAKLQELFGSKCLPDEDCNVASSDVASNVAGSKPKPTEPKFNYKVDDKVRVKGVNNYILCGKVGVIKKLPDKIEPFNYRIGFENDKYTYLSEEYLEPYTEPDTSHETSVCENHSDNTSQKEVNMNSNCNLSQETANCDKCPKSVQKKHPVFGHSVVKDEMIDSIIKDGFREHNRLYVAAMAMQGILSNQQLLKIAIETYQEETGSPDMYVAVAKAAKAQADALIAESEKGGKG